MSPDTLRRGAAAERGAEHGVERNVKHSRAAHAAAAAREQPAKRTARCPTTI